MARSQPGEAGDHRTTRPNTPSDGRSRGASSVPSREVASGPFPADASGIKKLPYQRLPPILAAQQRQRRTRPTAPDVANLRPGTATVPRMASCQVVESRPWPRRNRPLIVQKGTGDATTCRTP